MSNLTSRPRMTFLKAMEDAPSSIHMTRLLSTSIQSKASPKNLIVHRDYQTSSKQCYKEVVTSHLKMNTFSMKIAAVWKTVKQSKSIVNLNRYSTASICLQRQQAITLAQIVDCNWTRVVLLPRYSTKTKFNTLKMATWLSSL